MNKIFIYARPCVNKMTWAFFFKPGFRVSVLLSCSAVFLLFEIWKKPAKNCPIFLSALTFSVLIQQATKIKPKKTHKLHVSQIFRKRKHYFELSNPLITSGLWLLKHFLVTRVHLAFISFNFPVNLSFSFTVIG